MGNKNSILEIRKKALSYLETIHIEYGHFPLFDFYPEYAPKKEWGWHYMYKSPFVHASVLDALLNAGMDPNSTLIQNAAKVLLDFREPGDLWRYWDVYEAEHPTFSDVDETAISSFTLQKLGYSFKNKKIIYSRIQKSGEVHTWIYSDKKLFFTNPYIYFWLKHRNKRVLPILHQWKWIALDDHEPCIAANVIAYLGDNEKTSKLSTYIINGWMHDKRENYQHYDRKIILAYHIARAIKEGASSLLVLKSSVLEFIQSDLSDFSFPELLMAYLTVYYLDNTNPLIYLLKNDILNQLKDNEKFKQPYGYTTEKKKEYFGGSGALTAAWLLEATKDW